MPKKRSSKKPVVKKKVAKKTVKQAVKKAKSVKKSPKKNLKSKSVRKAVKKPVKKVVKNTVKKNKKKSVKRKSLAKTTNSQEVELADELLLDEQPDDIGYQRLDREAKELFHLQNKKTFYGWVKKYSPILIPLMVGLITYVYLTFFVFYPNIITNGHFVQFLFLVMFVFLLAGLFINLGIKHELLFIRILGFLFVFVILSFMVLFMLLANVINNGAV